MAHSIALESYMPLSLNQTEILSRPVSPVNTKLLFVIRRPGVVLLLGRIVGLVKQHVHQLEVNWPVNLQVNSLLLLLKGQNVILEMITS